MPWIKLSRFLARQRQRLGSAREESMTPQRSTTTIIVPLYIYPQPGAWEPLHASIRKHNDTRFLVIVNPGNGPGPNAVPDANYLSEIPRLTQLPNVDVVGYVHTSFARRDISAVKQDILTFARWADQLQYPGLRINGIFVDETPNQYDVGVEKYLCEITEFAKSCDGFGGDKLVIHNPGCAPSAVYLAFADVTVVFEDTYKTFNSRRLEGVFDLQKLWDNASPLEGSKSGREKLAIMIHSVPGNLESDRLQTFIQHAKETANVIFITDLDEHYYSNWSPQWENWVDLLVTM